MKHLLRITVLLMLVTFSTSVSADEIKVRAGASTTPGNVRVDGKVKMGLGNSSTTRGPGVNATSEVMMGKRSSSTRVEMQQGIAKRMAEHVAKVFSATVERLEKILSRIESRISKVKANGGVTVESEKAVSAAKAHLSAAKDSIVVFATIDLSATKFQENFSKVREQAAIVKMHIKEAHTSLMMAVRNLKGSGQDKDENASTTTATTSASVEVENN